MTETRNEAAVRLRQLFLALPLIRPKLYQATPDGPESVAPLDPQTYRRTLDEALATERRATIQRIQKRYAAYIEGFPTANRTVLYQRAIAFAEQLAQMAEEEDFPSS